MDADSKNYIPLPVVIYRVDPGYIGQLRNCFFPRQTQNKHSLEKSTNPIKI